MAPASSDAAKSIQSMRIRDRAPAYLGVVPMLVALLVSLAASTVGVAGDAANAKKVDFTKDIRPLLKTKCYACHGPDESEAGLRLDGKKRALAGGDRGPVIVPGNSAKSLLVRAVARVDEDLQMPPDDEGTPLTAAEVARISAWIDQGALWPDAGEGPAASSTHWAFQPIADPKPPHFDDPWVNNGIDAFILHRLRKEGVEPAAAADRAVLVRRLYLDLIGLPPSPVDWRRWMGDTGPDWYTRLVDHLLASPHYGERWGRFWLDQARYADSDGYEKDLPRPHAWRWRDWVIAALNDDMPFDQFTIEQLAGDLLPNATVAQRIATGFCRNTLLNKEWGVDPEEDRVKRTVDRTNTLGTVWLGLTVQCAHCHSHKYDPITQREYFGLYAFFNSLSEPDIALPRAAAAAGAAESVRGETIVPARPAAEEVGAKQETGQKNKETAKTARDKDGPKTKKTAKQQKVPAPKARTVAELETPRPTCVHLRGDFLSKGPAVEPGTPAVLPAFHARGPRPDRLDLARWLFDPANPLTARVIVNRIWQQYFGRGLVASSGDFGTQGDRPSHPELLDWLATCFRQSGFHLKALHRLIVHSSTYRQSSHARPDLVQRDPYNTWLSHQNRLRVEAEIIRDLALAASGLLHPKIGGPSVRPPQPAGVASLGYAGQVKWTTSSEPDRYRRGLYTFFQRTVPYPMLMTFDAPDSNTACTRRVRSNTPLQALTLWNDPVFVECARAMARRIVGHVPAGADAASTLDRRVRYAFLLCLGRQPTAEDTADLAQLIHDQRSQFSPDATMAERLVGAAPRPDGTTVAGLAAWVVAARTLINLDEFITRE